MVEPAPDCSLGSNGPGPRPWWRSFPSFSTPAWSKVSTVSSPECPRSSVPPTTTGRPPWSRPPKPSPLFAGFALAGLLSFAMRKGLPVLLLAAPRRELRPGAFSAGRAGSLWHAAVFIPEFLRGARIPCARGEGRFSRRARRHPQVGSASTPNSVRPWGVVPLTITRSSLLSVRPSSPPICRAPPAWLRAPTFTVSSACAGAASSAGSVTICTSSTGLAGATVAPGPSRPAPRTQDSAVGFGAEVDMPVYPVRAPASLEGPSPARAPGPDRQPCRPVSALRRSSR
jgi:hypothetical protein